MTEARCLEPKFTYLVDTECPVNTYVFNPKLRLEKLFLPLLANVSIRFRIVIHAYALLPDREIILLTLLGLESDLPGAMQQLHTNMNFGVRATTDRCTKIYGERRYSARRILNGHEALLAYVEVLTAAQNFGFSADNVLFGEAISSVESIGDLTERLYDRPECVKEDAQFVLTHPENGPNGQISLNFPLVPMLSGCDVGLVRQRVSELVDDARNGIAEFREQARVRDFPEGGGVNLPAPAAPRPADEYHRGETYRADFPYEMLLSEAEQLQLDALRSIEVRRLSLWRTCYQAAFKFWRLGVREIAFPIGTQKMRVIHNCRMALRI